MGQRGRVNVAIWSRVDGDVAIGKNIVGSCPTAEREPVVSPYDEGELTVGMVSLEMLQRVPGVRRLGQAELVVGSHEPPLPLEGYPCDGEPLVIIEKVGRRLLERVQRRHQEPNLVEVGEAEDLPRQAYVSHVYGVETAPEDAYAARLAYGHRRVKL